VARVFGCGADGFAVAEVGVGGSPCFPVVACDCEWVNDLLWKHLRNEWIQYLTIPCQVDFEGFAVVFKSQRSHGKENVLAIDSLSFLMLALLGSCGPISLHAAVRHADRS